MNRRGQIVRFRITGRILQTFMTEKAALTLRVSPKTLFSLKKNRTAPATLKALLSPKTLRLLNRNAD